MAWKACKGRVRTLKPLLPYLRVNLGSACRVITNEVLETKSWCVGNVIFFIQTTESWPYVLMQGLVTFSGTGLYSPFSINREVTNEGNNLLKRHLNLFKKTTKLGLLLQTGSHIIQKV